jgi:hypothetical protein
MLNVMFRNRPSKASFSGTAVASVVVGNSDSSPYAALLSKAVRAEVAFDFKNLSSGVSSNTVRTIPEPITKFDLFPDLKGDCQCVITEYLRLHFCSPVVHLLSTTCLVAYGTVDEVR